MTGLHTVVILPFDGRFLKEIGDFIVSIQTREFGIAISYEQQPDLSDIAGFYQQGAGNFWLAMVNGRVVGTIALRDIGTTHGALRKMFVAADHRGSDVARRLLETLIAHALTHGFAALYLGTTDSFIAAHRFYEKHGFVRIDPDALPSGFPRMQVDTRFYRRSLRVATLNPAVRGGA